MSEYSCIQPTNLQQPPYTTFWRKYEKLFKSLKRAGKILRVKKKLITKNSFSLCRNVLQRCLLQMPKKNVCLWERLLFILLHLMQIILDFSTADDLFLHKNNSVMTLDECFSFLTMIFALSKEQQPCIYISRKGWTKGKNANEEQFLLFPNIFKICLQFYKSKSLYQGLKVGAMAGLCHVQQICSIKTVS